MKSLSKLNKSCQVLFALTLSFWVVVILSSCSREPRYKESLIEVDSIKADIVTIYSETSPGSLVEIDLYGIISYNGCSSFSHSVTYVKDNDLIIEAWKITDTESIACPAVMVYLDLHVTFNRSRLPESFSIKVKQPDGTFLVKKME